MILLVPSPKSKKRAHTGTVWYHSKFKNRWSTPEPKDTGTRAKVIMTNVLVQHNLPIATSNDPRPLFSNVDI